MMMMTPGHAGCQIQGLHRLLHAGREVRGFHVSDERGRRSVLRGVAGDGLLFLALINSRGCTWLGD